MSHANKQAPKAGRARTRVGSGGLVSLRLTASEVGLLQRVIESDIACGAEDPDFASIHRKLHSKDLLRRLAQANTKPGDA